MLVDVAPPRELGDGHAPRRRVGFPRADVGGHERSREVVDADILARPHGRIHPAPNGIHAPAKRLSLGHGMQDAATHVLALTLSIDVAVRGVDLAAETRGLDLAPRGRVQRHLIVGLIVGALENVNLTANRPFPGIAEQPRRRPRPAYRSGVMFDVEDEEAVVVAFLRRDADAGAAGGVFGRVVDAHVHGCVVAGAVNGDEAALGGGLEVLVLDEAVCGVFLVEEDEFLEPVRGCVAVCESVSCRRCVGEEEGAGEEGEQWCCCAGPGHVSGVMCG